MTWEKDSRKKSHGLQWNLEEKVSLEQKLFKNLLLKNMRNSKGKISAKKIKHMNMFLLNFSWNDIKCIMIRFICLLKYSLYTVYTAYKRRSFPTRVGQRRKIVVFWLCFVSVEVITINTVPAARRNYLERIPGPQEHEANELSVSGN